MYVSSSRTILIIKTSHQIYWVDDVEAVAVDGDEDLAILVDDEASQTLGRGLDLPTEESTAVVRQRPAELKVFPDQPLGRGVTRDCLKENIYMSW